MAEDKLIKTINDFKKSLEGNTINIHGKEYATVAMKVALARRNLGSSLDLKDEIIHQDDKRVIVKTEGYIDGKHIATGMAEEVRTASRINQTSALENCQTSSWGRCLAAMGLTNDNIASLEEITSALEQQDQKVQKMLKELEQVSHAGNYQEWLTKNKAYLAEMKKSNPVSYASFMERYTSIKSQLKTNGAI